MKERELVTLVALVNDLFFESKIREIASQKSYQTIVVNNRHELQNAIEAHNPHRILCDLRLIDESMSEILRKHSFVAGFGPHVERERFREAREYGVGKLWANSALAEKLSSWL